MFGCKYCLTERFYEIHVVGRAGWFANIGSLKSTSPQAFTIFDSDGNGEIDIGKLALKKEYMFMYRKCTPDLCMRTKKDSETLENGKCFTKAAFVLHSQMFMF